MESLPLPFSPSQGRSGCKPASLGTRDSLRPVVPGGGTLSQGYLTQTASREWFSGNLPYDHQMLAKKNKQKKSLYRKRDFFPDMNLKKKIKKTLPNSPQTKQRTERKSPPTHTVRAHSEQRVFTLQTPRPPTVCPPGVPPVSPWHARLRWPRWDPVSMAGTSHAPCEHSFCSVQMALIL